MNNIPEVLYIDIYKGIYKSKNKKIKEKTSNEKLKTTNEYYKAVLSESGSIGQVFMTRYFPFDNRDLTTYYDLKCYTIVDTFDGENDFDYVNLNVLYLPYRDFGTCEYCLRWTKNQIWGTTPQKWGEGTDVAFRKWMYD